MLGVLTTHDIYCYDPSSFKSDRTPTLLASQPIETSASSFSWAQDKTLYISTENKIQRYDSTGNFEKDAVKASNAISTFVLNGSGSSVYYIADGEVFSKDSGSKPTLLSSQEALIPWRNLALSADGKLLAMSSSTACSVVDISSKRASALPGLPSLASQSNPITALAFHAHATARLILGTKKHLIIYDAGSLMEIPKTIPLASLGSASSDVVAIACSPFSKTLIAAATADGSVHLIDLESIKGRLRTLEVSARLTTSAFLRDGSAILLGTDNGRLLVIDLRATDKPPKEIIVGSQGDAVLGMAIQEKGRPRLESAAAALAALESKGSLNGKPDPSETTKPLTAQDINKNRGSRRASDTLNKSTTPTSASLSSIQNKPPTNTDNTATPGRKVSIGISKTRKVSSSRELSSKSSKEPAPVGISRKASGATSRPPAASRPSSVASSPRTPGATAEKRKSSLLSAKPGSLTAALMAAAKKSPTSSSSTRNAAGIVGGKNSRTVSGAKPRIVSGSKPHTLREATPPVPPLPSALSLASASDTTTKENADVKGLDAKTSLRARTLSLLSNSTETRGGIARAKSQASVRTLTPDLPSILDDPISPPLAPRQKGTSNAHGGAQLETPDVVSGDTRVEADNAKTKDDAVEEENIEIMRKKKVEFLKEVEVDTVDDIERIGSAVPNELQITPLRRRPSGNAFPTDAIPMQVVSPFRKFVLATSPARGQNSAAGSSSAAVQELLRSVMQDVMYDFRQETRDELVGLHLDLVRMGRVWKNEIKTVMDEYMGDMRKLLDENQKLREENERLSRGY